MPLPAPTIHPHQLQSIQLNLAQLIAALVWQLLCLLPHFVAATRAHIRLSACGACIPSPKLYAACNVGLAAVVAGRLLHFRLTHTLNAAVIAAANVVVAIVVVVVVVITSHTSCLLSELPFVRLRANLYSIYCSTLIA